MNLQNEKASFSTAGRSRRLPGVFDGLRHGVAIAYGVKSRTRVLFDTPGLVLAMSVMTTGGRLRFTPWRWRLDANGRCEVNKLFGLVHNHLLQRIDLALG